MKLHPIVSCLLAMLLAAPTGAADEVTDAMQAAYPPYRAALFRTNSQAQAESEQALASARRSWQSVIDRYAARPPVPYDRDPGFATTLVEVGAVYQRAEAQVREKQLKGAHETLEAARGLMADLRRRNGVVVYSDPMNAYHAEMEHLIDDGPKLLAQPQAALQLMARAGTLEYLARQLRSEAPPAITREPDFAPLLRALEDSVAALKAALLVQDVEATRKAIGALKGPYSRMFMRFA
jgi:hypothetical protein